MRGGLLIAAFGCAACDRSDSVQATQCARFCAALEKCDDGTDLSDCEDLCGADRVHSDAYFRARAECGEELSCNLWVTEVDNQGEPSCQGDCKLVDCVDDALAKQKPSAEQEQACGSIGTKVNACDSSLDADDVERACVRATPLLSPAYAEDSRLCVEQRCGEISTCLDDLADSYGTELRLLTEVPAAR